MVVSSNCDWHVGEGVDTPGAAVHAQLQRIKRQLSAVKGGEEVAAVQNRSMLTPPPALKFTPPPSIARPGTASTVGTARTPLSAINSVANEQGEYWHRRYAHRPFALFLAQLNGSRFCVLHRRRCVTYGAALVLTTSECRAVPRHEIWLEHSM
jgi:hypothetical protein